MPMEAFPPKQVSFSLDSAPRLPARGGSTRVRRFNGIARRTHDWDGLRKDDQLWFEGGDCLVYFYKFGTSQRGASLKVPFEAVERLQCEHLMQKCLIKRDPTSPLPSEGDPMDRYYDSLLRRDGAIERPTYELYIPAPPDCRRELAFAYHITTRNLLAYAVGRPLVGERLSIALIEIWKRIRQWGIATAVLNFSTYLEKQGYLDFAENAEHALACLKFAEHARLREMWIDAYVHCVGMHDRLDLSPEFAGVSNTTSALITRASLEMDLHIARVTRSVGSFLEEELGREFLGLSKPARAHLDYFRSFLHAFYVDRFGYFPPSETSPWDKRPWIGMREEFQNLYEYLADTESSHDEASNRVLNGGICVKQNVQAFNQRHGYPPLAHPLPLVPQIPLNRRNSFGPQKGLLTLKPARTNSSLEAKPTASEALASATNRTKIEVVGSSLVKEYRRFERQRHDEKLDIAEARKVRWILIYGILQMLSSITEATQEVRDVETPSYPLCVLTTGCPPWAHVNDVEEQVPEITTSPVEDTLTPDTVDDIDGRSSRISIHPDCEADNADDFFASNCTTRRGSDPSITVSPAPLKVLRNASIRSSISSVQSLHRSVVGSISRRNATRRASRPQMPREMPSFNEAMEDSNDSTSADEDAVRPQTSYHISTPPPVADSNDPLLEFDFDLAGASCGHTDLTQFHKEAEALFDDSDHVVMSPCESNFSATSGDTSDSNRSSLVADEDSPDTELSSLDGDDWSRGSPTVSRSNSSESQKLSEHTVYRPKNPNFTMENGFPTNVSAGCYIPSGMVPQRVSSHAAAKTTKNPIKMLTRSHTRPTQHTNENAEEVIRVWPKSKILQRRSHLKMGGDDIFYEKRTD